MAECPDSTSGRRRHRAPSSIAGDVRRVRRQHSGSRGSTATCPRAVRSHLRSVSGDGQRSHHDNRRTGSAVVDHSGPTGPADVEPDRHAHGGRARRGVDYGRAADYDLKFGDGRDTRTPRGGRARAGQDRGRRPQGRAGPDAGRRQPGDQPHPRDAVRLPRLPAPGVPPVSEAGDPGRLPHDPRSPSSTAPSSAPTRSYWSTSTASVPPPCRFRGSRSPSGTSSDR
jgi:hypothetical protein